MSNIIIPTHLADQARSIYKRIDELGLVDELERDSVLAEDEGILVGGRALDPTLPFGGRLRGSGDGVRVGDGCGTYTVNYPQGPCGMPPVIDPCTFRDGQRLCDMQKVAKSIVVAGGGPWTLMLEPKKSPYFDPKGVRARVTALGDTTVEYDALCQAVEINSIPQEGINEATFVAPTVAGNTVEGWWLSDWRYPTKHAVPVSWAWFSKDALGYPLLLRGGAPGISSNILLLVTINVYGNLLTSPPNGVPPGGMPIGAAPTP